MQPADYQPLRTTAKWVTGLLVLYLAADVYQILVSLEGLEVADQLRAGEVVAHVSVAELERAVHESTLLVFGAFVPCVIAFCIWTHRAARNALSLGAHLRDSPAAAVGYYFVPIFNLWRPYQALAGVWRGSHPDVERDPAASMSEPMPWWFRAWWLVWLASGLVEHIAVREIGSARSARELTSGLHWWIGSVTLDVGALLLVLTVLWRLTRRQEARAAAAMPPAHVVAR